MKTLLKIFFLVCALSAQAGVLSLNGVKPAVIVDVRTPEEYAAGHIDGARNIPVERIGQDLPAIKELGKDSPILLYCRSGHRASIAKAELEKLGYRHVINGGGMQTLQPQLK